MLLISEGTMPEKEIKKQPSIKSIEKAVVKNLMEIFRNPEALKHKVIHKEIDRVVEKFYEDVQKEEESNQ